MKTTGQRYFISSTCKLLRHDFYHVPVSQFYVLPHYFETKKTQIIKYKHIDVTKYITGYSSCNNFEANSILIRSFNRHQSNIFNII